MQDSIEFFNQRAREGTFDSFTEEARVRLLAILDDIHFPTGKPLKVMDCGCGTGRAMEVLARRLGSGAEIVGADNSPDMIARAREIRRPPDGVKFGFVVADCVKLPFETESFDWILVIDAFPHFKDMPASLQELKRVLKDGGYLGILSHHSGEEANLHHQKIGGPVANDFMPKAMEFMQLFRDSGLWLQIYVDDAEGFRSLARK